MSDPIVPAAAPSAASKTPAKSTDPSTADAAQAQGFASIVLMQLAQVLHLMSPGDTAKAGAATKGTVSLASGKSLPLSALLQSALGGNVPGQTGGAKGDAKNAAAPGAVKLTVLQGGAQGARDEATLLQAIFPAAGDSRSGSFGKQSLLQALEHAGLLKGLTGTSAQGAHDGANAISTVGQMPVATRTVSIAAAQAPAAVPIPVQHQGWADALASRVAWQIGQNIQHAEIHLNPPNLGPLDVKISLQHDQASVQFAAHHALVRDALHDAIPKLREMLSQQGLNLADANVSHQSPNHGGHQQPSHQRGSEGADFPLSGDYIHAHDISAASDAVRVSALGLIDDYA